MGDVLNEAALWATIGAFGVAVLSLVVIAFQATHYMALRKADQRQREFENYHALLDLALGGQEQIYVDRQTAAIFELRNYRIYSEYTLRMLSRLLNKCEISGDTDNPAVMAVIEESRLTIEHLNGKQIK